MTEKYCIENDFAAQKELAEMERTNIDKQWEYRLELNALRTRAERAASSQRSADTTQSETRMRIEALEDELAALKKAARDALMSWSCDCKHDRSEMFKKLAALVGEG